MFNQFDTSGDYFGVVGHLNSVFFVVRKAFKSMFLEKFNKIVMAINRINAT
jgi:hypothetical protein